VEEQARLIGAETQRRAQDTAQRDADFERQTAWMSDLDKQIASVQRQLHGDGWKQFMDDGLSATIRLSQSLRDLKKPATIPSLGQMMEAQKKMVGLAKAGRPSKQNRVTEKPNSVPTLAEAGIDKNLAHQALRRIAA
jgi:hypothetical protein